MTFTGIKPEYASGIQGLDDCVWTINLNDEEIYNGVIGQTISGKNIPVESSPLTFAVSGISPEVAKSLIDKDVLSLNLTLNVGQSKEEAKAEAQAKVDAEKASISAIGNDIWTDDKDSLNEQLEAALATFNSAVEAARTPEEIIAAKNNLNTVINSVDASAQTAKADTQAKKAAASAELDKVAANNKTKIDLLNYDEDKKSALRGDIDTSLNTAKTAIAGPIDNSEDLNDLVTSAKNALNEIYDEAAAAVRPWEFTWSPTTPLSVEAGGSVSLTSAPVAESTETRADYIKDGDPEYSTSNPSFTITKDASGIPILNVASTVSPGKFTITAYAKFNTVVNYGTELTIPVQLSITVSTPVPTATAFYCVEGTGTNKTLNISPTKRTDSYIECEKIITGFDLSSIQEIPWSSDWANIKSVVVHGNATSKIKPEKLDLLFCSLSKCDSITGLDNIDTSASTSMYGTFLSCTNIENLDLSSFTLDPSKMTNMTAAFFGCEKLKTISFSEKFDTSGVTTMEQMFDHVGYSVEEGTVQLDLRYFKNDNLTNVKKMFSSCNSLTNIYVNPNNWKRDRGTVEYTNTTDTFYSCPLLAGCSSTTHKTYYMDDVDEYKSGNYAFFDVDDTYKGLFSVTGSTGPDYVYWGTSDSNELSISPDRQETTFNASYKLVDGLTSADDLPWKELTIYSVNILQSKDSEKLSLTKLDYLFAGLTTATEFTGLTNIVTTNVTSMSYLFNGDANVTELDLSGWTKGSVDASSEVSGMFNGCSALARIWADDAFDLSELTGDASTMFTGCSALKATQGTKFDSSQTTNLYARHDNRTAETSAPGYFSDLSAPRLFWGQSADNTTLYISPEKTTNATTEDELPLYAAAEETDIPWKPADAASSTCTNIQILVSASGLKLKPASMMNWFDRQKKCTSLTGLDNIDTSVLKSMKRTFRDCSFANLDLSNFATDSVTDMAGIFTSCQYLETLKLTGKFNTKNVTDMSAMFLNIGSLIEGDSNGTQITFPTEFDASSAKTMKTMFSMAKPKNYTLDLSSFKTTNELNDTSGMFYNANNIGFITFGSGFVTTGVTTMSTMFGAVSCTTLDLTSFSNTNLTDVGNMFLQCSNLTTVYADNTKWTRNASYTTTTNTFNDCTNLVGKGDGHQTTYAQTDGSGDYAYVDVSDENPGLFSVYQEADAGYWGVSANTLYLSPVQTSTATTPDEKILSGFASAEERPWNGQAASITNVVIEASTNAKLAPAKLDYLFTGLTNATEFTGLSNIDTTNVESMVNLFNGDAKVVDLDLKGWTIGGVDASSEVAGMFNGCSALARIWTDSSFDFSELTSPTEMFTGCAMLKATQGSAFSSENVNSDYACIDKIGEDDQPHAGYFSDKTAPRLFWGIVEPVSAGDTTLYISPVKTTEATNEDEAPLYSTEDSNMPWWVPGQDRNEQVIKSVEFQKTTDLKLCPKSLDSWFSGIPSLSSITGLNSTNINTDNLARMNYTFCETSLAALDLSNLDASNVRSLKGCFANCVYLENLKLFSGDYSPSSCTDMSTTFSLAGSFSSGGLSINFGSSFNVPNLKTMSSTFSSAKFTNDNLDLSNFNVGDKLEDLSNAFADISYEGLLKSITFPTSFNTSKVTDMSGMFGFFGGTELDLTSFSNASLTNVEEMFVSSQSLTTIYVDPDKWTRTQTYTTKDNTFYGCTSLVGKSGTGHETAHGTGTDYDSGEYAYIDESDTARGLLSVKQEVEAKGYWGVSDDKKTLTLAPDKITGTAENESEGIISGFASASAVPWINDVSTITTVSIQKVEGASLEPKKTNYLLSGLTALTAVEGLENLSTTNVEEMKGMFEGCTSLETLNISTFTNGKIDDGSDCADMFKNCSSLTKIYVNDGNFDLSELPNPASMFEGCTDVLKATQGTNYKPSKATTAYAQLDKAFDENKPGYFSEETAPKLYWGFETTSNGKTLHLSPAVSQYTPSVNENELPMYVTEESQLPDIPWGKSGAPEQTITKVVFDIVDGKTIKPSSLSGWFYMLVALTSIDGLNSETIDTSVLKLMYGTFGGCVSMQSLDLSGLDTTNVISMNSAFYQCTALTSVTFEGSFTTKNVQDFTNTFGKCSALTNLDLTSFDVSSAKTFESMFDDCIKLQTLNISQWNTNSAENLKNMFHSVSNNPSSEGVEITGLNSLNTSSVTNMMGMFQSSKIKNFTVSNFNTEQVEDMSSMFKSVKNINNLDLSNFSSAALKYTDGMFAQFEGKEIDISGFKTTQYLENYTLMFASCTNLESVYVDKSGEFKLSSTDDRVFDGTKKLVGENGTSSNRNYGDYDPVFAVFACLDKGPGSEQPGYFSTKGPDESKLYYKIDEEGDIKTLHLSSVQGSGYSDATSALTATTSEDVPWLDSAADITKVLFEKGSSTAGDALIKPSSMSYWFYNCQNLADLQGWENVKTGFIYDLNYTFYGCSGLAELDLSKVNSINLTKMDSTFFNCTNLKMITADINKWTKGKFLSPDFDTTFSGCVKLHGIDNEGRSCLCYDPTSDIAKTHNSYATIYRKDETGAVVDGLISDSTHGDIKTYWTLEAIEDDQYNLTISDYDDNTKTMFADNTFVLGVRSSSYNMPWHDSRSKIAKVNILTANNGDKIQVLNASKYFYGLQSCEEIVGLDKIDLTETVSTEQMFYFYSNEARVPLNSNGGNFETSNKLVNTSQMFYDACLPHFDLSVLNTSNVTNMSKMFYGANFSYDPQYPNMSYLSLCGSFSTQSVVDITDMFAYTSGLTKIIVGDSSYWPPANVDADTSVFTASSDLVGHGTDETTCPYNGSHVNADYAKVCENGVGYLTLASSDTNSSDPVLNCLDNMNNNNEELEDLLEDLDLTDEQPLDLKENEQYFIEPETIIEYLD